MDPLFKVDDAMNAGGGEKSVFIFAPVFGLTNLRVWFILVEAQF